MLDHFVSVFAVTLGGQFEKYGAYVGVVAFFGLAVLIVLAFAQARELKRVREWAEGTAQRGQELEARVLARLEEARKAQSQTASPATTTVGAAAASAGAGSQTRVIRPTTTIHPAAAAIPAATAAATAAAATAIAAPPSAVPASQNGGAPPTSTPSDEGPALKAPSSPPALNGAVAAPPADPPATEPSEPAEPSGPVEPAEPSGPLPSKPTSSEPIAARPAPSPPRPAPTPAPSPPRPVPIPAPRTPRPAAAPAAAYAAPGGRRPERAHGGRSRIWAALLGLGAIAAVAGLVFLGVQLLGSDDPSTPPQPNQVAEPGTAQNANGGVRPSVTETRNETTVAVLNGTTSPGLAQSTAERLVGAGYAEDGKTDTGPDQTVATSTVYYARGLQRQARDAARVLGISETKAMDADNQALAGENAELLVIVGADKTP